MTNSTFLRDVAQGFDVLLGILAEEKVTKAKQDAADDNNKDADDDIDVVSGSE